MTCTKLLGLAVVVLASPWIWACFGSDPTGGDEDDNTITGTIIAATTTTGPTPDPDGYAVGLNEGQIQSIGVNASVTFSDLTPSTYSVLLDGIAPNCVVAASNPVVVMLLADSTQNVQFELTCS